MNRNRGFDNKNTANTETQSVTAATGSLQQVAGKSLRVFLAVVLAVSLLGIIPLYEQDAQANAADATAGTWDPTARTINLVQADGFTAGVNDPARTTSSTQEWAGGGNGTWLYFGNYYYEETTSENAGKQPLKWRVLDTASASNQESGTADSFLLMTDQIIDHVLYTEQINVFETRWAESNLRQWLNSGNWTGGYTSGGFLNTAFGATEKNAIKQTSIPEGDMFVHLDNPAVDNDKIFLLSASDMDKSEYGFRHYGRPAVVQSSTRLAATPYAIEQGVVKNSIGYANYYLRSISNLQLGAGYWMPVMVAADGAYFSADEDTRYYDMGAGVLSDGSDIAGGFSGMIGFGGTVGPGLDYTYGSGSAASGGSSLVSFGDLNPDDAGTTGTGDATGTSDSANTQDDVEFVIEDLSIAGVVPSLNLGWDSVLYVSEHGATAPTTFGVTQESSSKEWDVVLKNDDAAVQATLTGGAPESSTTPGSTLTVNVSGISQDRGYAHVSGMLVNSSGAVVAAGPLTNTATGTAGNTNGTYSLNLPVDLPVDNYTLKVFAETTGYGSNAAATNEASIPVDIAIKVQPAGNVGALVAKSLGTYEYTYGDDLSASARTLNITNLGRVDATITDISVEPAGQFEVLRTDGAAGGLVGAGGVTVSPDATNTTWSVKPTAQANAGTTEATVTITYNNGTEETTATTTMTIEVDPMQVTATVSVKDGLVWQPDPTEANKVHMWSSVVWNPTGDFAGDAAHYEHWDSNYVVLYDDDPTNDSQFDPEWDGPLQATYTGANGETLYGTILYDGMSYHDGYAWEGKDDNNNPIYAGGLKPHRYTINVELNNPNYELVLLQGFTTLDFNYATDEQGNPHVEPTPSPAVQDFWINYTDETVTLYVVNGIEIHRANTQADFQGEMIQNGDSITPWIADYGEERKTLYLQITEDIAGYASEVPTEVLIPARPAAPADLASTETTGPGRSDGTITGVDSSMEYRLQGSDDAWTRVQGLTIEGLSAGVYEVRYRASDYQVGDSWNEAEQKFDNCNFASSPTTVEVVDGEASGGLPTIKVYGDSDYDSPGLPGMLVISSSFPYGSDYYGSSLSLEITAVTIANTGTEPVVINDITSTRGSFSWIDPSLIASERWVASISSADLANPVETTLQPNESATYAYGVNPQANATVASATSPTSPVEYAVVRYNGTESYTDNQTQLTVKIYKATNQSSNAPTPQVDSALTTATSITLTASMENAGKGNSGKLQYSKDNGTNWQDSPTFTELTPGTEYRFVTRWAADNNYVNASAASAQSEAVTTPQAQTQDAPTAPTAVASGVQATSITVNEQTSNGNVAAQFRIKAEGASEWGVWQDSTTFTNLTPNTSYVIQARFPASGSYTESDPSAESQPITTSRIRLTVEEATGTGVQAGFTATAEYGTALSDIALTTTGLTVRDPEGNEIAGTWSWQQPDAGTTYPNVAGSTGYSVQFTPTSNPDWYLPLIDVVTPTITAKSVEVTISGEAQQVVGSATPLTATYADVNGAQQEAEVLHEGSSVMPETAGVYELSARISDTNYQVGNVTGVTSLTLIGLSGALQQADGQATESFTYGDIITVAGTLTGAPQGTQIQLMKDDVQLESGQTDVNGTFSFTYDTAQKGLSIGENTLTLTSTVNGQPASQLLTANLAKKDVTVTFSGDVSREYDETTNVPAGIVATPEGVLPNDQVSASATYTFTSANAGTRDITVTDISLTGDHVGYYNLTNTTGTHQVDTGITKAANTLEINEGAGLVVTEGQNLTLTYSHKGTNGNVEVSITKDNVAIPENQITTSDVDGQHTVTVTGLTEGAYSVTVSVSNFMNYQDASDTAAITVNPRSAMGIANAALYDGTGTSPRSVFTYGESLMVKGDITNLPDGTAARVVLKKAGESKELAAATLDPGVAHYELTYNTTNKDLAINENILVIEVTADDQTATHNPTAVLNKLNVTATFSGDVSKTYDETATVPAGSITATAQGVLDGDNVGVSAKYAFESANADTKLIKITDIMLTGNHAGYYNLTNSTADYTVNTGIQRAAGSIRLIPNETTIAAGETYQFSYEQTGDGRVTATIQGADGTNTGFRASATVDQNAKTISIPVLDPGAYTLTVDAQQGTNHTSASDSATITVSDHPTPGITAGFYDSTGATLLEEVTYGDSLLVKYAVTNLPAGVNPQVILKNETTGKTLSASALGTNNASHQFLYNTTQKGLIVGENRLVAELNVNGQTATHEFVITLKPQEVAVSFGGNLSKVYDGNTNVLGTVNAFLKGVLGLDQVSFSARYAYDSPNANTTQINVLDPMLGGEDASFYTLQPVSSFTVAPGITSALASLNWTQQAGNPDPSSGSITLQAGDSIAVGYNYVGDGAIEMYSSSSSVNAVLNRDSNTVTIEAVSAGEAQIYLYSRNETNYTRAQTQILTITVEDSTSSAPDPSVTATLQNNGRPISDFIYGDTVTVTGNLANMGEASSATVRLMDGTTELASTEVDLALAPNGAYSISYNTTAQGIHVGDNQLFAVEVVVAGETVASQVVKLSLNPLPTDVRFAGTATKTYDTTANLPDDAQIITEVLDLIDGDALTVTATYAFIDANANTTRVQASGISLGGDDAAFYTYTGPETVPFEVNGGILAATGKLAWAGTVDPSAGLTLDVEERIQLSYTYEGDAPVTYAVGGDASAIHVEHDATARTLTITGRTGGTATLTVNAQGGMNYTDDTLEPVEVRVNEATTPDPTEGEIDIYRLYNPNSGLHHYTTDMNEVTVLVSLGWRDEGPAFKVHRSSGNPTFRAYNPNNGTHNWTMDAHEQSVLAGLGWHDEGTAWFIPDYAQTPVYRLYNPTSYEHLYTTDKNEYDTLVRIGWNGEGVGWMSV